MKLQAKSVEMTSTLILSERETELLAWLAGYGPKALAELIGKKLTTRYEAEEWEKFWSEMRSILETQSHKFIETRNVFIGNQKAVWPAQLNASEAKGGV